MAKHEDIPEHTGKPDCPACALINRDMTPQQHQQLVDALMIEFADMVDLGARKLKQLAAENLGTLLSNKDDKKL